MRVTVPLCGLLSLLVAAGLCSCAPPEELPAKELPGCHTGVALEVYSLPVGEIGDWRKLCNSPRSRIAVPTGHRILLLPAYPEEFGNGDLATIACDLEGLGCDTSLDLSGTRVTNAGLVHLSGFSPLTHLSLNGTAVTDAGVVHLEGLSGLQSLDVQRTRMTSAGAARLRARLPGCTVIEPW